MPSPEAISSSTVADQRPRLVVLVGPTAVGKTELSIQLAERLDGEIISADSRLFYIGMDIGTAKPTQEERARVPHHLIDVTTPDRPWSLAVFQEAARQAVQDITARGRLPLLVGGTGQYVRAVIEGWQTPAVEPDPRLRLALDAWGMEVGKEALHQRLAKLDPQAAAGIDARNMRRTVRALEVILTTGKRFSEQRQRGLSPYRLLLLGLTRPRPELYARVDARIQTMFSEGWLEETRLLLAMGYTPDLPALSAIGYQQIIAYLQGALSLEAADELIRRQTRVFVRRQANWFKLEDPAIHWFQPGPHLLDAVEKEVRLWLEN